MKIFTIARQEWNDKRMVWVAAFAVGLLCFAIPGLMGYRQMPLQDGRDAASVSVAFIFTGFMALICGAGMIAPDLQEGRFGFFLSRPVKPGELFFGKWLGAALVSLGVGLLVLLPTSLAQPSQELILPGLVPLTILALLGSLVGHAFSTALRARTIWLLLDAITLLLLAAGTIWGGWRLLAVDSGWEWMVLFVSALVACIVGLGIVGWRQVALARTDLKGHHRVLSIGAMALVLLLGLGGWTFIWNAVHVNAMNMGPAFITRVARQGPWVHMMTESWLPRFEGPKGNSNVLVNTDTGRGIRIGSGPLMSADGNRAIWSAFIPFTAGNQEIWMAELGPVDARVRRSEIQAPYLGRGQMVLSADGRKLATVEGSAMVVYDLDMGTLLARGPADSAHFMNTWKNNLLFIGPDTLRCYNRESTSGHDDDSISIWEMDLNSGRIRTTGHISLPGEGRTTLLDRNPTLDQLLVYRSNEKSRQIYLCDGRTGAIKQTLKPEGENPLSRAGFLSDGSIVFAGVTGWGSGSYWAKHLDATGQELALLHLGAARSPGPGIRRYIRPGAETKPGLLILRTSESNDLKTYAHQNYEVDFKANTVRTIPEQAWEPGGLGDDLLGPVTPGSLPTRLRVGLDGAVSIREGDQFRQITKGRNEPVKGN